MDWFYECNVFNVLTFDRAIISCDCPTVYIVVYFSGATRLAGENRDGNVEMDDGNIED